MRLDKFLKVSRIIKRRTVANEACDAGKIEVNGVPARASYSVKIGDVITVKLGSKVMEVEVLSLDEHVRKEQARDMYKIVNNNDSDANPSKETYKWQYVADESDDV